jgi:alpha/beta hydrolase family protein
MRSACLLLLFTCAASAEVDRIEIRSRDALGPYERIIGRVYYSVDPKLPANRGIADIALAPANSSGRVEFSGDFMVWRPRDPKKSRGTVFLEAVNRGGPQSTYLMENARGVGASPEQWDLGDHFRLDQGFTVVFLGWQFDVPRGRGLALEAPAAPVTGTVRQSDVEDGGGHPFAFGLAYCAADAGQPDARLTFRTRFDEPGRVLPRAQWRFGPNGCSVQLRGGLDAGLYEAIYQAKDPPVAGLGLAALRDFASYLKYGGRAGGLRENPASLRRIIGYGYSQSARLFRSFVRDGFNADEQGRAAFDALFISSAGAGGASINHRFAMPGEAGNSVLSILRPVDIPPFTDDGLLAKADAAHVTPKIFYTFSSTEYWARAGSLTHTTPDGRSDVPPAKRSRLYFLTGTPHSAGPLPPTRGADLLHYANFAEQGWVTRALLLDLDAWIAKGTEPPPSRYPAIAQGELVAREAVRFPKIPALPFPTYMPQLWRMDFGPDFLSKGIIANEPPSLGAPFTVLVPQVDADGNDQGGVRLPEIAVPLGTYTGWNVHFPELPALHFLAGLYGSFEPFARTAAERERTGDARRSIAERYKDRQDYLDRVQRAARELVRQRLLLAADIPAVLRRAGVMWDDLE